MLVNFGLEGTVTGMTRHDYDEITAQMVPGTTETMHSFVIPQRLITPGSSKSKRTINILAAFVSPKWVWVIHDFMRLARIHVISRDKIFDVSDFDLNGPVCTPSLSSYISYIIYVFY